MTTKRLKATVNPALLVWARKSAGYDIEEAAAKLNLDPDRLMAWETDGDEEAPSIPQLRKIAELYKRPLAVLYLPEPPLAFQPMHDFRRLPEHGARRFSPGLTLEIRAAHQRRTLALELFDEDGEEPQAFALKTTPNTKAEVAGAAMREALGIDYKLQSGFRDHLTAFRAWRSRIEDLGVLVFQASRLEESEASGFAYWAEVLPFIVVNSKDAYPRRTFSLLHELAHLMLHQSGVSDGDPDAPRPPSDQRVEIFCNQVAAAALMPRDLFLAEPIVAARGAGQHEWSDEDIRALSVTFGASRDAVARRLFTFNRATEAFYKRKHAQYLNEYRAQKLRDKEKNADKTIARNMPRETIANFGQPFVRKVLEQYHSARISLSEVSGYLGVKAKHIAGIEQNLGLA
ncbi:Zn-dependent peptidase ImmA (M78 family) [Sphingobium xanthum]|uniref:XRE family transcriptional regulator n=1 Tax=Sphingobium xanthum TaxID=1387165 RepID=UPI001C8CB5EE|nr:XRE family transcriptional regulator [Sphingobium xanthum]